jgi:DNA-binding transcriptional MerR regulator
MADIGSLIKNMKGEGKDNSKIIDELKNQGHSSQDIHSAMNQTNIDLEPPSPGGDMQTSSLSQPMEMPEESIKTTTPDNLMGPQPSETPAEIPQRENIEQIEEIAESIVEEKIQEFSSSIGNLDMWKERTNAEIGSIKQEILRLRNHLENLQTTMAGKVEVYNKSVVTMGSEMKALSKVMEKIMQPLTMNVKELSRITEKFKKIK